MLQAENPEPAGLWGVFSDISLVSQAAQDEANPKPVRDRAQLNDSDCISPSWPDIRCHHLRAVDSGVAYQAGRQIWLSLHFPN